MVAQDRDELPARTDEVPVGDQATDDAGCAKKQRARLPAYYNAEPGEGRLCASPSNPSLNGHAARAARDRAAPTSAARVDPGATIVFRCSATEKVTLLENAAATGENLSTMMRRALGLAAPPKRHRRGSKTDPALLRQIASIEAHLAQLARTVRAMGADRGIAHADALAIVGELVAIDRRLSGAFSRYGGRHDD
jgi:hypothetical protein